MLASEVDVLVPIGGMEQCAFVVMEPGNGWPLPVVQNTRAVSERHSQQTI